MVVKKLPDLTALENQRVLVVGLGLTGIALTRFLVGRKATVTVTDQSGEDRLGTYPEECRRMGVTLELGGHREATFKSADWVVVSPGVPLTIPPIAKAIKARVPVTGEMELAACYIQEPIAAVTGTNGKTTTTALLGEMLKKSGKRVFVGGNIGSPLIGHVDQGRPVDAVVVEVSSFQLDTVHSFRPRVGVLLNVTPDHLDRYPDLMSYARAKGRLFENQTEEDVAVLNGGDPIVREVTGSIRSRRLFFSGRSGKESGAIPAGNRILLKGISKAKKDVDIHPGDGFNLEGTYFTGRYGQENAAAACLAALSAGATHEGIQAALNAFKGLPHRLETVGIINDVRFVNDSKATNVYSVLCALEAFASPLVLIMGGRDKGSDFTLLREGIGRFARKIILIGEAAGPIRKALKGVVSMEDATDMVAAVKAAFRAASPGDVVLLSPACASFDMFSNYAHRGENFREAVKALS